MCSVEDEQVLRKICSQYTSKPRARSRPSKMVSNEEITQSLTKASENSLSALCPYGVSTKQVYRKAVEAFDVLGKERVFQEGEVGG